MIAKAETKYIRISPTKVRPVIDLIRGNSVKTAESKLVLINKRGAFYLAKVLKSAVANAKVKGHQLDALYISKVIANPGPTLKRFRAASFGRASGIKKRTSHILIELDTREKRIEKVKVKKTKTK
jgi:large subunit ribosomal protein L22